jgi:DNA-directed RNA polymerase sigma subunit (sigma70/sigma32)
MGRKICTDWYESPEAKDKRIDAMLREMVVENGLELMAFGHEPKPMTLEEIADFVGVGKDTIDRIQNRAVRKLRKKMLNLKG